jgi:autotransporter-associated beta strand protein
MKQNLKKFTTRILTALVASFGLSVANAQENFWTGASSTDWNTAGNWSLTNVPAAPAKAIINNGASGNIATISADISATPRDIDVRNGSRLDHTAGTAGTSGGAWMFVGQDNSAGTYNLANTGAAGSGLTGFAQGTGSLNATGNLLVGAFGDNRTGTVRVNTSGTLAVSGELFIGDSLNSAGNFSLESGTMTVNNKIFVGNNRGTGTMTMSGGTLTKTGGDDTFVGRDAGTGTLTQSGGTVTLNHNLYVGQSSGSTGTYNISGSSVLNTGRDFVIGREGGTGSLNMTGGTITKTGDEKFLVGHNNGVGTVVQSGGTISANNELYIGDWNAGSGTYTLSGTGALNVANEVVVGRESGTGTLNVNGGTITTSGNGNMYVGRRNGTGTLNQTDGTIVVNKEFGVGTRDDGKIGTGTYNLSGGSLSAVNDIFIGKEQGSSGTMIMTDGTISTSSTFRIGHNQSTGVLTQSGGTVNVQNEVNIGNESGTGTLNLNGGTIMTKKLEGGNGSATVNFNGGVLKAKENQDNLIQNLDVANVQSGGAKIDSNGFNVATSQALTGAGGLEKLGAGSLTLSANNTYAGTTTVSQGTLAVNGSLTGGVHVTSGSLLKGSGIVGGASTVNGTLAAGNSPGQITFSSDLTLGSGSNLVWELFGNTSSDVSQFDRIAVGGNLLASSGSGITLDFGTTAGGSTVDWSDAFWASSQTWTFLTVAGTTTGFSDLSLVNSSLLDAAGNSLATSRAGATFSLAQSGNNVLVSYAAVPEPSSAALTLLGLVSTLALARRRR